MAQYSSAEMLWFFFLLASLLDAGWRLNRRAQAHMSRENALLLVFCALCAWVIGLQTVLGLAGWLKPGPLLGMQILALVLFIILDRWKCSRFDPDLSEPFPDDRVKSGALRSRTDRFFFGILFFFLLTQLFRLPVHPPHRTDSLSYHLPFVVGWMETGRLGHIPGYLLDGGEQGYPLGHELLAHWVMAPIRSDLFVMLPGVFCLFFLAVGVAAVADRLGAPRWAGRLAALMLSTSYFSDWLALTLHVDLVFACFWTAAFSLGLAFFEKPDCRWRLVGFSLAFGLAACIKTTHAVYGMALLAALWFLVPNRQPRKLVRPFNLVVFLGLLFLLSGFWFGRNLIRFGNPFYPVSLGLLGRTLAGQAQEYGLEGSDSLLSHVGDPVMWRLWVGAIGWRAGVWIWGLLAVFFLMPIVKSSQSMVQEKSVRNESFETRTWVLIVLSVTLFVLYWMTPWQYRTDQDEFRRYFFLAQALRYGMPWLVASVVLWSVVARRPVFAGWLVLCGMSAAVQALWREPWGALFVLAGGLMVTLFPAQFSPNWGGGMRRRFFAAFAGVAFGLMLFSFSSINQEKREAHRNRIYWRLLEGEPGQSEELTKLLQLPSGRRVYFLGCNVPYVFQGRRLEHHLLDASRRNASLSLDDADWEKIAALSPDVLVLRKGEAGRQPPFRGDRLLFETQTFLVLLRE